MTVLSRKGLDKISKLQDKYQFRDAFEIIEPDEVIDFLQSIRQAYFLGLNIEVEDLEFIEDSLEKLTS